MPCILQDNLSFGKSIFSKIKKGPEGPFFYIKINEYVSLNTDPYPQEFVCCSFYNKQENPVLGGKMYKASYLLVANINLIFIVELISTFILFLFVFCQLVKS